MVTIKVHKNNNIMVFAEDRGERVSPSVLNEWADEFHWLAKLL